MRPVFFFDPAYHITTLTAANVGGGGGWVRQSGLLIIDMAKAIAAQGMPRQRCQSAGSPNCHMSTKCNIVEISPRRSSAVEPRDLLANVTGQRDHAWLGDAKRRPFVPRLPIQDLYIWE